MKIVSADITGSLIVNGVDVTTNVVSSSIFSGSIAGRVTSLEQFSASLDATFATDASVSASILVLSQSVQASQAALSSSYALTSGSYAAASASLSTRVTTNETNITTLTNASASFAVASGSLSTRVTNLESTSSIVSSSFATTSGSLSTRVTIIEGQDATTGSNTFTGVQYVSQASNAISFTSTASLYTDGGLRVAKDSFVSGTAYFNNITVYGTSSIQYITSSQVNVGTNIITVNTDTPAVRFGGLAVFDSGSTQLTGSMLWDSEKNHWVYSNPSGSSYSGGMLMSGPRSSALGDEQGTLSNYVMKGQGGDHITSSQIIDDGTTVRIPGNLQVTGSTILAGVLTGIGATFTGSVNISGSFIVTTTAPELTVGATGVTLGNALTDIHQVTGSLRVTGSGVSYILGGNVGVGTAAPNRVLDVNGVIRTQNAGSAGAPSIELGTSAQGNGLFYPTTNTIAIATNDTERLRITSGGNLQVTGSATFSSTISTPAFISSDTEFRLGAAFARVATLDAGGGFGGGYNLNWNNGTPIHNSTGTIAGYGYANDGSVRFYANVSSAANTAALLRFNIGSDGSIAMGNFSPSGTPTADYRSFEIGRQGNTIAGAPWKSNLYLTTNATITAGSTAFTYRFSSVPASFLGIEGGEMTFANASSGTAGNTVSFIERMRISSGGNIISGYNQTTSNTIGRTFATSHASGNRGATLFYGITDGGNGGMFIYNVASSAAGHNSQYISFETHEGGVSTGERMRITSGGSVLIGYTTNPGNYRLVTANVHAKQYIAFGLNDDGRYIGQGDQISGAFTANDLTIVNYAPSGTRIVISNYTTGVALNNGATSWSSFSDERLKNVNGSIENALEKLLSIRAVKYSWKTDETNKENLGLIAQDVEKVFPQVVDESKSFSETDNTEYLSVRYTELIPVLVKAIQELEARIKELENK